MPDLATLIGYPSGQLPSTGSRPSLGCRGRVGVGVGGGAGRGAGDGAGVGAGLDVAGSLRRCIAVQTANAAPLITASKNSGRSHGHNGADSSSDESPRGSERTLVASSPQPCWRSKALSTARSDAVVMFGSWPMPQRISLSLLTVSTYALPGHWHRGRSRARRSRRRRTPRRNG